MCDLAQDDVTLWGRVRDEGDERSFGVLFERHMAAVFRYCTRQSGSYQAAEDLTSQVFLEVWRCRAQLIVAPPLSSALPLLYGIAFRVCSHHRRGGGRFAALLRRLPPAPHVDDHAQQVVDEIAARQRLVRLAGAMSQLSPAHREVVDLCVIGHMSTADVATALGVAEGTVKSRLSRARERLRVELEPVGGKER